MQYFLILFYIFASVQSALSDCSVASTSENKYLTLIEPLKGQIVEVIDSSNNYTYRIGFCKGIAGLETTDVGVEQYTMKTRAPLHAVGRTTATSIVAGTNWIFLEYRNGDNYSAHHCHGETRRATIFIMCDPSGLLVKPVLIEENNERDQECAYVFEVGSSLVCSNSTSTPSTSTPLTSAPSTSAPSMPTPSTSTPSTSPSTPSSSGIGVGGIIVISALTIAATYLILGVLYKRVFLRAKGREQIPNSAFWTNFGNLTADGCDFVCRCNKEQSKSYKAGLGDDQLVLAEEEERDENILPM